MIKKLYNIKNYFKSFFKDDSINGIKGDDPIKSEFKKNIKTITDEYGENIVVSPHEYGTAKVTADLLKRIKSLENKIK